MSMQWWRSKCSSPTGNDSGGAGTHSSGGAVTSNVYKCKIDNLATTGRFSDFGNAAGSSAPKNGSFSMLRYRGKNK